MDREFIEKLFCEQQYFNIVKNTIIVYNPKINIFDLDDCVSEVYKIAMQKKGIEKHPNIKGWLSLTAKNVVMRYIVKKSFESKIYARYEDVSDCNENFIEDLEMNEYYKEIIKKLSERLTKSEYNLFKYRYIDGLSSKEISRLLGIKPDSVDTKYVRLKKKFLKILNNM